MICVYFFEAGFSPHLSRLLFRKTNGCCFGYLCGFISRQMCPHNLTPKSVGSPHRVVFIFCYLTNYHNGLPLGSSFVEKRLLGQSSMMNYNKLSPVLQNILNVPNDPKFYTFTLSLSLRSLYSIPSLIIFASPSCLYYEILPSLP